MNLSLLVISSFFSGCNTTSDSASDADTDQLRWAKTERRKSETAMFSDGVICLWNWPIREAGQRRTVTYAAPRELPLASIGNVEKLFEKVEQPYYR